MVYIALPDNSPRLLPFYLAMEEYVANHIDEEDCFFMWQVEPSVIFGRNQLIENEVNLDYCKKHGINFFRRKSGGGCVYADLSNVMLSYITKDDSVNFTYHKYTNLIVWALAKMGIQATASGRNDILIEGKKVSGNAFYHLKGRNIVHGTMLYDTNMEHMMSALTPDQAKLRSKGVESIRQHVTLLKDHTSMSLEAFKKHMRSQLCQREIVLTEADIQAIEERMKEYLTDDFIYGKNPSYSLIRKYYLDGVGNLEIRLSLKNGLIKNANILGDYFLIGDIDKNIIQPLRNAALTREDLEAVIPEHTEETILHLKKKDLIDLLMSAGEALETE